MTGQSKHCNGPHQTVALQISNRVSTNTTLLSQILFPPSKYVVNIIT